MLFKLEVKIDYKTFMTKVGQHQKLLSDQDQLAESENMFLGSKKSQH